MVEPKILRAGKEFHKRVQEDWKQTASGGRIAPEHTISLVPKNASHTKHGRLDIFVDETGDFVSVIEIKSTDWDAVLPRNRKKLLGSHRRQVWRYIKRYIDTEHLDVCPGIIYRSAPVTPDLKEEIEEYLNDWGLQVVWYDA
jgi:hypothetical protein